ncbi:hypothetical protein GOBAR_AA16525 [Gossypium barbadense]|uniref:Uncharacterized protein n=1 Tax=Gossypium barbadense TaxID=3634 RepID=A0A2P5XLD5_GOSBA|nr:hypothetical protein GOBAR_AA16525 [Gossypium barbadense]
MAATKNISMQAKFGCEKELETALLCLRGDKADISHEAIEIKDYVESPKSFLSEGILDIFQKKYVRPLLTVAGVLVLMNLGGINALTYYSGVIFVSAGVSSMVVLITLATTQVLHPLDIEGAAEDSISSSWKSQGLALLQVERYLMLHSMVINLSRNLNFVLWKQGFVATLCNSFFNHDG